MKFVILLLLVVASTTYARPSSESEDLRLIKTAEETPAVWLNQEDIHALISQNINFKDITGRTYPKAGEHRPIPNAIPTALRFEPLVKSLLSNISIPRMTEFITQYSEFHNRYYTAATGVEAANWLLAQVQASIAANPNYPGNVSVAPFTHTWAQNSVIAQIQGSNASLKSEVVVLGAHLDSVSQGATGRAPGADDNASGSVVLLETLRVLLATGVVPQRTLEFQWYAAEEVGLRGSADIASAYSKANVDVVSMINFDVVGYHVTGTDQIGLLTDYTDKTLTDFLKVVIDGYLVYTWTAYPCGYACSDHASYTDYGYPAACPGEVVLNPYMHTTGDTIARVHFEQVNEFTKLAVGFAVEVAEPSA